jgi:hypothetical protein
MPFQSDKRLYLTADDQVVEEGDERAVSLLVGAGGQLSDAQAAKYGLGSAREATPQAAPKSDVPAAESEDGSAEREVQGRPHESGSRAGRQQVT